MANQQHLDILKQGIATWNKWREEHPSIRPNLSSAKLNGALLDRANFCSVNLKRADLDRAHLSGANLSEADLYKVDFKSAILIDADLSRAKLHRADFYRANLSRANLSGAALIGADLSGAVLTGATLIGAKLHRAISVRTNLTKANLTNCEVYGISAWDVKLEGAVQLDLIITLPHYPIITVDNLEVAQFIYLLLNNQKLRDVIDTITSKVVLILGRFSSERKVVLDALRDELRKRNYSPVVFDIDVPAYRDITETISLLARMARYVIADITDAKSIPQELSMIVPDLPSVPIQPLLQVSEKEYSMFEHFKRYPWVLPTYKYDDVNSLLASLKEHVIDPAEQKAQELAKR